MSKSSQALTTLAPEAAASLRRLGERLRAHRLRLGWTIADMAQRLFCAPATYRALEAGKPGTSLGILANALWLFGQLDSADRVAPITSDLTTALVKNRRVRRRSTTPAAGTIAEDERDF